MARTGTAMQAPTAIIVSVSRKTLATAMLVSTRWLWIKPSGARPPSLCPARTCPGVRCNRPAAFRTGRHPVPGPQGPIPEKSLGQQGQEVKSAGEGQPVGTQRPRMLAEIVPGLLHRAPHQPEHDRHDQQFDCQHDPAAQGGIWHSQGADSRRQYSGRIFAGGDSHHGDIGSAQ